MSGLDRVLCAVYEPLTLEVVRHVAADLQSDPVWAYVHPGLDMDLLQAGTPVGRHVALPLAAVPVVLAVAERCVLLAEELGAPPREAMGARYVLQDAEDVEDTLYRVTGPGRAASDRPVTVRGAVEALLDRGLAGVLDELHLEAWVWRAAQARELDRGQAEQVLSVVRSRRLDLLDALALVGGQGR